MAREIKTAARMRLVQGRQLPAKADIEPRIETNITMKQRLLRTPPPECDESLLGYVIRLTEANHYDNASWVTSLAGLNVSFSLRSWKVLNPAGRSEQSYPI